MVGKHARDQARRYTTVRKLNYPDPDLGRNSSSGRSTAQPKVMSHGRQLTELRRQRGRRPSCILVIVKIESPIHLGNPADLGRLGEGAGVVG